MKTIVSSVIIFLLLSCHHQPQPAKAGIEQYKIDNAVSCTPNGLNRDDSIVFMNNGGKDFDSTIENTITASKTPTGMKLIPGGTFSMGGVNPIGISDGGNEPMNDARPIHKVYVDAFLWMKRK